MSFWDNIPVQVRTVINVALGALLAWAATDGIAALTSWDISPIIKTLLVGVATAVVRSLNPVDTGYGINGASSAQPDPASGSQDA